MKTPYTAVVVIPPSGCWEPIQAIRREHDRKIGRWMPHISLLFPFRPRPEFDEAARRLTETCLRLPPFPTTLAAFRGFEHRPDSHTIWLDPEPLEPWSRLQATLHECFPDCDDIANFEGGYRPHLSVGQSTSPDLARTLQASWQPLPFDVAEIALIWRTLDRPFEVDRIIKLGA